MMSSQLNVLVEIRDELARYGNPSGMIREFHTG
jgi:hypothetical protein